MKILLVNDVPLTSGHGTEQHICTLADAFREIGHQPYILTGQRRGGSLERTPDSIAIPDLATPLIRKRPLKNLGSLRRAIALMREYVREVSPDIIHVHNLLNPFSLAALWQMGPVVKSIHDCRPFCSKPPDYVATRLVGKTEEFCSRTLGRGCWRRCYLLPSPKDFIEASGFFVHNLMALRQVKRCERIIVYSDYLRNLALQAGCRPEQLELIHHFIDFPAIDPAEQTFPAKKKIVFVGRLSFEKGIMQLLEAIRAIPEEFETVLVGDGPLREPVRALLPKLNKRVTLPGYMNHDQLVNEYREASLVVFPSIGSEGCPLVGLEALAHGKPVVGFNVGGVPEWLVDGVTGYLVPRGDVALLSDRIRRLLVDRSLAQRMGQEGIRLMTTKFRKDLHIGRLLQSYSEAVQVRERHAMNLSGDRRTGSAAAHI